MAGCVEVVGDKIRITDEWYRRIHAADDVAANEVESMLEFQQTLLASDWDVQHEVSYAFNEAAYDLVKRCQYLVGRLVKNLR